VYDTTRGGSYVRASRKQEYPDGYVITERGRLDLVAAPVCNCNPRLAGLLIECPDCGTIYGSLRDSIPASGFRPEKRR